MSERVELRVHEREIDRFSPAHHPRRAEHGTRCGQNPDAQEIQVVTRSFDEAVIAARSEEGRQVGLHEDLRGEYRTGNRREKRVIG